MQQRNQNYPQQSMNINNQQVVKSVSAKAHVVTLGASKHNTPIQQMAKSGLSTPVTTAPQHQQQNQQSQHQQQSDTIPVVRTPKYLTNQVAPYQQQSTQPIISIPSSTPTSKPYSQQMQHSQQQLNYQKLLQQQKSHHGVLPEKQRLSTSVLQQQPQAQVTTKQPPTSMGMPSKHPNMPGQNQIKKPQGPLELTPSLLTTAQSSQKPTHTNSNNHHTNQLQRQAQPNSVSNQAQRTMTMIKKSPNDQVQQNQYKQKKNNPYIKLVAKLATTANGIVKRKVSDVHDYNTYKHAQQNKANIQAKEQLQSLSKQEKQPIVGGAPQLHTETMTQTAAPVTITQNEEKKIEELKDEKKQDGSSQGVSIINNQVGQHGDLKLQSQVQQLSSTSYQQQSNRQQQQPMTQQTDKATQQQVNHSSAEQKAVDQQPANELLSDEEQEKAARVIIAQMFEKQRQKAEHMNGSKTTDKTIKNHQKWLYDVAGGPEQAKKMIEEGHQLIVGNIDYKKNYPAKSSHPMLAENIDDGSKSSQTQQLQSQQKTKQQLFQQQLNQIEKKDEDGDVKMQQNKHQQNYDGEMVNVVGSQDYRAEVMDNKPQHQQLPHDNNEDDQMMLDQVKMKNYLILRKEIEQEEQKKQQAALQTSLYQQSQQQTIQNPEQQVLEQEKKQVAIEQDQQQEVIQVKRSQSIKENDILQQQQQKKPQTLLDLQIQVEPAVATDDGFKIPQMVSSTINVQDFSSLIDQKNNLINKVESTPVESIENVQQPAGSSTHLLQMQQQQTQQEQQQEQILQQQQLFQTQQQQVQLQAQQQQQQQMQVQQQQQFIQQQQHQISTNFAEFHQQQTQGVHHPMMQLNPEQMMQQFTQFAQFASQHGQIPMQPQQELHPPFDCNAAQQRDQQLQQQLQQFQLQQQQQQAFQQYYAASPVGHLGSQEQQQYQQQLMIPPSAFMQQQQNQQQQQHMAMMQPQMQATQGLQPKSYLEELQSKQIVFQQSIIYQLYQVYIQQRFQNEQINHQMQLQHHQQQTAALQQTGLTPPGQLQNLLQSAAMTAFSPFAAAPLPAFLPQAPNFSAGIMPPSPIYPTIMHPQVQFPGNLVQTPTIPQLMQNPQQSHTQYAPMIASRGASQFTIQQPQQQAMVPPNMMGTPLTLQNADQILQYNQAVGQAQQAGKSGPTTQTTQYTQQQQLTIKTEVPMMHQPQPPQQPPNQLLLTGAAAVTGSQVVPAVATATQQQQQSAALSTAGQQQAASVVQQQQTSSVIQQQQVLSPEQQPNTSTPVSQMVNQQSNQHQQMLVQQQVEEEGKIKATTDDQIMSTGQKVAEASRPPHATQNHQQMVAIGDQQQQELQRNIAGNENMIVEQQQQMPEQQQVVQEDEDRVPVHKVHQYVVENQQENKNKMNALANKTHNLIAQSAKTIALQSNEEDQKQQEQQQLLQTQTQQQIIEPPITKPMEPEQRPSPDGMAAFSSPDVQQDPVAAETAVIPHEQQEQPQQQTAPPTFINEPQPDQQAQKQKQTNQQLEDQQLLQQGEIEKLQHLASATAKRQAEVEDCVELFNGQGTVNLDDVLQGVLQSHQQTATVEPQQPISTVLQGKGIYFDMHVDAQFPNIFREKGIKQPFTQFHIKTNIEAKASQLINTLLEKLVSQGRKDSIINDLGITQRNISLYFHCDKGNRWWFENTQRVADIIDSGYWKPESILKNDRSSKGMKCIYFVIYKRY